jgi:hypothetical protein
LQFVHRDVPHNQHSSVLIGYKRQSGTDHQREELDRIVVFLLNKT